MIPGLELVERRTLIVVVVVQEPSGYPLSMKVLEKKMDWSPIPERNSNRHPSCTMQLKHAPIFITTTHPETSGRFRGNEHRHGKLEKPALGLSIDIGPLPLLFRDTNIVCPQAS